MYTPDQYRADREERRLVAAHVARLRRLGYPDFPIRAGDKRPLTRGWQELARRGRHDRMVVDYASGGDAKHERTSVLDYWSFGGSIPNVGIATGRTLRAGVSLLVLDVDERHGGTPTLNRLGRFDVPPETLTVITPGGRHYYFRHDSATQYTNNAGRLGEGLDVRGQGGFVVCPPSVRPDGSYMWEGGPSDVADLAPVPEWLVERLAEITPRPQLLAKPALHQSGLWRQFEEMNAEDWLVNAAAMLLNSVEGERNDRLASLMAKGLFYAVDGLLDPDTVTEVLCEAASEAGLGNDEIAATARSITTFVAGTVGDE